MQDRYMFSNRAFPTSYTTAPLSNVEPTEKKSMTLADGQKAHWCWASLRRYRTQDDASFGRLEASTLLLFLPSFLLFFSLFCITCGAESSDSGGAGTFASSQTQTAASERSGRLGAALPTSAVAWKENFFRGALEPFIGQDIPLAVPSDVRNVPQSNAIVRLHGVWTEGWSNQPEADSEICISLINVALSRPWKKELSGSTTVPSNSSLESLVSYDLRGLTAEDSSEESSEGSSRDGVKSRSPATPPPPKESGERQSTRIQIDPSEFPATCEESFRNTSLSAEDPLQTMKTTVCGPDRKLSNEKYMVFVLPVTLLEFVYVNFDVLGKSGFTATTNFAQSRWLFNDGNIPGFSEQGSKEAQLQSRLDTVDRFGKDRTDEVFGTSQYKRRSSEQLPSDIRFCFRATPKQLPIEVGKAMFHPAPSPKISSEPPQISIKVRKFINPGWEWNSNIEGMNFTSFNFMSLKYAGGDSSHPCGGFGDSDTYMTTPISRVDLRNRDERKRAFFRFEEDFRNSPVPANSENRRQPLFNVCLYADANEETGTKMYALDFVIDPKDATLFVAFIIFVLLCILICGITISCYAFKHRRLRKKLRRLRLVQQRDDIERRLMIELGIGEVDEEESMS